MNHDPLQRTFRDLAAEQASEKPSDHVQAALLEALRGRGRRRRFQMAVGAMATAAALAAAVWLGSRPDSTPQPSRVAEVEPPPAPIVTDFVPLDYGLTHPGVVTAGRLTRITLPPTAPRDLGFPIPPNTVPDGVQADLLLSEDGTPQAVRFVLPYR